MFDPGNRVISCVRHSFSARRLHCPCLYLSALYPSARSEHSTASVAAAVSELQPGWPRQRGDVKINQNILSLFAGHYGARAPLNRSSDMPIACLPVPFVGPDPEDIAQYAFPTRGQKILWHKHVIQFDQQGVSRLTFHRGTR